MDRLVDAIVRVYDTFILRDLLGFTFPGSIFLISLYCLLAGRLHGLAVRCEMQRATFCIDKMNAIDLSSLQLLVFLGISFVTGWTIQTVHFGIVDWIYQVFRFRDRSSIFWPVTGVIHYVRSLGQSFENPLVTFAPRSLITRGALAPELYALDSRGRFTAPQSKTPDKYFERISALMLMTANNAIAGIPLLILLATKFSLGWWTLLGVLVLLIVYLEHWRLFHARNLRHELMLDASRTS